LQNIKKNNIKEFFVYIFKACIIFGIVSIGFSIIGTFLESAESQDSPLENSGFNFKHLSSHVLWGAIAGVVSFSLRYLMLAGVFTIIMDFDHLIGFVEIDAIARMTHSIPFAIIAPFIMMGILGKKDYMLGIISFAAVFSHISLDIFIGTGEFPIFAPFSSEIFYFYGYDWIGFQIIAIISVVIIVLYTRKIQNRKKSDVKN